MSSSSDVEADRDKDTSDVGVKLRMSSTSAKGRLPIEHVTCYTESRSFPPSYTVLDIM